MIRIDAMFAFCNYPVITKALECIYLKLKNDIQNYGYFTCFMFGKTKEKQNLR